MEGSSIAFKDDVSIVLCGEAGLGIQTVEQILMRLLKRAGYHIFGTKEYMSRIRGGSNSTAIRVSSERRPALVDRIDLLIPFDPGAVDHVRKRLSPETVMIGDRENLAVDEGAVTPRTVAIPLSELAAEIGGAVYSNIIAAGLVAGLFDIAEDEVLPFVEAFFSQSNETVRKRNTQAAAKGLELAGELRTSGRIAVEVARDSRHGKDILLNGAEAVGIGALAGGCDFIAAYPMSPATGVLTFLSQQAETFGIVAEQAEDEIGAVNMTLGAWYAGGRAMVTTSGGGFALMEEGISLAGIIENPAVIHLAQRPGPATGLPTRTEQGDLNLVLYAGHGEFPRIILAPGRLEEAVELTRRAFDLADRFQVPVFVLTDQYFIDSYYTLPDIEIPRGNPVTHVVETGAEYARYRITDTGISPRGIPGYGSGLVAMDSDEHDEAGHITEDLHVRVAMMEKRLRKLRKIENEALPPTLVGREDYTTLVLGWGSTYHVIAEALSILGREDVSFLHFSQVYPLPAETKDYLKQAGRIIVVEGNATAQFARLLTLKACCPVPHNILKYNGMQFSVEELVERLGAVIDGGE